MAPTRIPVALFTFLYFIVSAVGETCYYPDGSTDSGHFACSSGGTSVCCAEGFQCLSNGLCNDYRYENYERVLRGGCTDKNWGDGCPQTCTSIWPQGDEVVYLCGNGKYCCGRSADCCNDSGAEFFAFGSPSVIATAGKTQAQATSAPEVEDPQSVSKEAQQQTKTQDQGQQQTTKASSQQDQPQETQSQQEEGTPSATEAKGSSNGATDEPANSSTVDNSGESATKTNEIQNSSSDPIGTAVRTASPSDSGDSGDSASGPTATNTIINNITTPSSSSNTVAIAVGVGVGVGVLLFLLALAGCWYIRRKRRGPGLRSRDIFEIEDRVAPAEAPNNNRGAEVAGEKPWKESGIVYEMDGGSREAELPAGHDARELQGESGGTDKKWPNMFK